MNTNIFQEQTTIDPQKASEIKLDRKFRLMKPALSPIEYQNFCDSIAEDGIRDALVVWKETNILVDGYQRLKIAIEQNLSFRVIYKSFATRDEAQDWIIRNFVGRRANSGIALSYIRGEEAIKALKNCKTSKSKGFGRQSKTSILKEVAEKYGVAVSTIRTDIKYAESIDSIDEDISDETAKKIVDGEIALKKPKVAEIGKAIKKAPEIVAEAFEKHLAPQKILKCISHLIAKRPEEKKFRYPVGTLVNVHAHGNPELNLAHGFYGIIVEASEDADLALVQVWCGRFWVRTKNVSRIAQSEGQIKAAAGIIHRLARIADSNPTAPMVAVMMDISRRVVTALSDLEENWLCECERKLNLGLFDASEFCDLGPISNQRSVDHRHGNWVVEMLHKNLEGLSKLHLSSLAESLMKKRPDEVVSIVMEFSQDEELLKKIVGNLKEFHSDLFENGQDYAAA